MFLRIVPKMIDKARKGSMGISGRNPSIHITQAELTKTLVYALSPFQMVDSTQIKIFIPPSLRYVPFINQVVEGDVVSIYKALNRDRQRRVL